MKEAAAGRKSVLRQFFLLIGKALSCGSDCTLCSMRIMAERLISLVFPCFCFHLRYHFQE